MSHPASGALGDIVEQMCELHDGLARPQFPDGSHHRLPRRERLIGAIEELRTVLFPGYFSTQDLNSESVRFHVGASLDRAYRALREQILRALCFACEQEGPQAYAACEARAETTTRAFLAKLPGVRARLATDVQAAYDGDPAAMSLAETILCYPGILAVTDNRLAHELYQLGVPLLPRMISEYAHGATGIDIHPGATIGERFFIDHGTGVVIGETCIIGDRVRIYQGVTLGAKSFQVDERGHLAKGIPRHPIVEDDVVIYGGATVLGRITIGKGSIIGGNVWLTQSVPPGSRVTQGELRTAQFFDGAGI